MESRDLTLALVQADLAWENVDDNLARMDRLLAGVQGARVIVLPEMFTTGFSMNAPAVAETMNGKGVNWLLQTARRLRADVAGSLAIADGGHYYNRLVWAKPDGSLRHYDKRHLFSFAGEDGHYTPGREALVVEVDGWRIAPFICYDLRFPVWTRNREARYDLALYVANWPQRRAAHWKALLPARAIENQSYVIGLNRVGADGNGLAYSGDSLAIDPYGETLWKAQDGVEVRPLALSRSRLEEVRTQFPFLQDADDHELR
ncbi:MAG: amidohydrolase [Aquabacterium sp.]|nr:MAG: amidohydrolase [Aquabacterium sp.]